MTGNLAIACENGDEKAVKKFISATNLSSTD